MRTSHDIDWPVHSLMLSFHDLRGLLSSATTTTSLPVHCSMISGRVSWQQTYSNHDNLQYLTVDGQSSRRPARILTCCHTYLFVLCSPCDTPNMLLWHLFSKAWTRLSRSALFVVRKVMALFFHSIASLVMVEYACASLIFTSFIDVPSLVLWILSIWTGPLILALFHYVMTCVRRRCRRRRCRC